MDESATAMVGQAVGEIAAAAYDGFSPQRGAHGEKPQNVSRQDQSR
jgi:hypothetical protein